MVDYIGVENKIDKDNVESGVEDSKVKVSWMMQSDNDSLKVSWTKVYDIFSVGRTAYIRSSEAMVKEQ